MPLWFWLCLPVWVFTVVCIFVTVYYRGKIAAYRDMRRRYP